jgi:hypothetical protein
MEWKNSNTVSNDSQHITWIYTAREEKLRNSARLWSFAQVLKNASCLRKSARKSLRQKTSRQGTREQLQAISAGIAND